MSARSRDKGASVELWGGIECTINRIGDRYRNQLAHDFTAEVDAAVALGITALRYPVLWEQHADAACWEMPDDHLARLRTAGVRPIIGLVHHGSGPPHTSLTDVGFAAGLARHARIVAERYPWVDDWTPVNEPLTTARFSALYGHWYPHVRDEAAFWLALLNQIDGVRLAMQEIRAVNAAARLIQTEDLGRTYARAGVEDQAALDNQRRWMTWDLLAGRVDESHPLWSRIASFGLADRLRATLDAPCSPDVIGINHYLTSDRFLDPQVEHYPEAVHGGNGRQLFADVEAIRVLDPPPNGLALALQEAWQRYATPIAITEIHNHCTREEQMRWTAQAWETAHRLRDEGVDIVAVTPWALTGSTDWRSLLTRDDGHYECGVFDRRGPALRPTAMVPMLQAFARDRPYDHPVLAGDGWWERPDRLIYPAVEVPLLATWSPAPRRVTPTPILITGATGTLGRALAAACHRRGLTFVLTNRAELDVLDPASIGAALARHKPWAVINASGWVRVDEAEAAPDACFATNTGGAIRLAEHCLDHGIRYVGISSDLVFDGHIDRPYLEGDATNPLNIYGASKARAEQGIDDVLTIRTAAFFSPHDRHNFAHAVRQSILDGQVFRTPPEYYAVTPTYVPHLVDVLLDLLIDDARGIWHVSNGEELSWGAFARHIAVACGLPPERITTMPTAPAAWTARRPHRSGLGTARGIRMPLLSEAIERFARVAASQ